MEIKVRYLQEALDFLKEVDTDAKKKILYNVKKVRLGVKDKEIFKKLEGSNIWEFRTLHSGNCYRLLSFWDTRTNTLIVATNGFMKKTGKTPKKEIEKAETLRKEYFENN
jgi:phage-related protein